MVRHRLDDLENLDLLLNKWFGVRHRLDDLEILNVFQTV